MGRGKKGSTQKRELIRSEVERATARWGQQFFEPLPSDVIQFWLDGKYSGGLQQSVEYDRLGWALMLRGVYEYCTKDDLGFGKSERTHRGYAIFDLCNGELKCYGIRTWTGASWDPLQKRRHPLLWRSDICSISVDPVDERARLRCVYRLLCPLERKATFPAKIPSLKTAYDIFRDLWGGKVGPEKPHDIQAAESGWAVTYLIEHFENDWPELRRYVNEQSASMDSIIAPSLSDDNQRNVSSLTECPRWLIRALEVQYAAIYDEINLVQKLQKHLAKVMNSGNTPPKKDQTLHCLKRKKLIRVLEKYKFNKTLKKALDALNDAVGRNAKDEANAIESVLKLHLACLVNVIRPQFTAGFTLDLHAVRDNQPVEFSGVYGAYGKAAVGGHITFRRLDAFTFNR